MKTTKFDNEKDWLNARLGKITGTKLKDLIVKRGNGKKIGYYQLIADKLAIPGTTENAMERGKELEPEAIEKFVEETGKKVDASLVMWHRDDNEAIAYSPDGVIGKTEAVEAKCLSSARHIEALLTQQVPKDYQDQVLQAFIVNDKLKKLYLVFYDDRMTTKQFFYLTIERDQEKVDEFLEFERKILEEVDQVVSELSEL